MKEWELPSDWRAWCNGQGVENTEVDRLEKIYREVPFEHKDQRDLFDYFMSWCSRRWEGKRSISHPPRESSPAKPKVVFNRVLPVFSDPWQQKWSAHQEYLRAILTDAVYRSWIPQMEFKGISNGEATFLVTSEFWGNYVSNKLGWQIKKVIKKMGCELPTRGLQFVIKEKNEKGEIVEVVIASS